ncbi:MAG: hypothetical protein ACRCY9_15785 [Phycicoccus sp.]
MTPLAYLVVGVVSLLTVVNLLLTFGVIRKLARMTSGPMGALVPVLAVGTPTPSIVTATIGASTGDESTAVVAFLARDCEGCHAQLSDFERYVVHGSEIGAVITIVSQMHADGVGEQPRLPDDPRLIVIEESLDGPWQQAFQVRDFPSFYVLDGGRVSATSHHVSRLPVEVG